MLKKRYLTLGIFSCLVFLITGIFITMYAVARLAAIQAKHDERVKNLYTLLCEPFDAETTPEEILNALAEIGDFTIAGNDKTDPNLSIVFNDSLNKEIYGRFTIIFHKEKYVGASISTGFEQGEVICSFR